METTSTNAAVPSHPNSNGAAPIISATPINQRHQKDLQNSGIPLTLALQAGLRSASEAELQRLLNRKNLGDGLAIPYHDHNTGGVIQHSPGNGKKSVDFVRVRLDDPSKAADKDGRPSKYLSRYGSGQEPYILPQVAAALKGGAQEVMLVEGEKKALSGVACGFNVIGLSGNYGWKKKDSQALLPRLDPLLKGGQTVVIVWDSDAALNVGFAVATRMLHDILRRRGCVVKFVVLPQSGTNKVGLDDFLVANGGAAFRTLVDSTPVVPSDRQVTIRELLLTWLPRFTPALALLPIPDATSILRDAFRKGFVDRVDFGTQRAVLSAMATITSIDVPAVFRTCVMDHLAAAFSQSATQEANPGTVSVGCTATETSSNEVVEILELDPNFAWVAEKGKKSRAARPVPFSALKDIKFAQKTEADTAASFADELINTKYKTSAGELILRCKHDTFYTWRKGSYSEVPDTDMRAEIMGFLRNKDPKKALPGMNSAIAANMKAAGVCHIPADVSTPCWISSGAFTEALNVIPFPNGILDLNQFDAAAAEEETFKQPTPLLFSTTGRPFDFDVNANCPKWRAFLNEILPLPELQIALQELFGLCQVPDTSYQRFFIFHGPGSNGKGVVSDVLAATVGVDNVCSVPLSRFGERFSLWPLTTALVNAVAEMPSADANQGLRQAEDKLKAIVSGDFIEVEKKNKDIIKSRATARVIFSCNELPLVADRSNGVWRRLVIIPFQK